MKATRLFSQVISQVNMKTRKTNRAKAIAKGCGNNRGCDVCTGNRQHANVRAEPIEQIEETAEELRGEGTSPDDWPSEEWEAYSAYVDERDKHKVEQDDERPWAAFCDFCPCPSCQHGWEEGIEVTHAPTEDGRWICDVCFAYDLCTSGPDRENEPCLDRGCRHRPKLVGPWVPSDPR